MRVNPNDEVNKALNVIHSFVTKKDVDMTPSAKLPRSLVVQRELQAKPTQFKEKTTEFMQRTAKTVLGTALVIGGVAGTLVLFPLGLLASAAGYTLGKAVKEIHKKVSHQPIIHKGMNRAPRIGTIVFATLGTVGFTAIVYMGLRLLRDALNPKPEEQKKTGVTPASVIKSISQENKDPRDFDPEKLLMEPELLMEKEGLDLFTKKNITPLEDNQILYKKALTERDEKRKILELPPGYSRVNHKDIDVIHIENSNELSKKDDYEKLPHVANIFVGNSNAEAGGDTNEMELEDQLLDELEIERQDKINSRELGSINKTLVEGSVFYHGELTLSAVEDKLMEFPLGSILTYYDADLENVVFSYLSDDKAMIHHFPMDAVNSFEDSKIAFEESGYKFIPTKTAAVSKWISAKNLRIVENSYLYHGKMTKQEVSEKLKKLEPYSAIIYYDNTLKDVAIASKNSANKVEVKALSSQKAINIYELTELIEVGGVQIMPSLEKLKTELDQVRNEMNYAIDEKNEPEYQKAFVKYAELETQMRKLDKEF